MTQIWEVVPKGDVEILYEDLEPHPRLPRSNPVKQQPPAGAAAQGQQQQQGTVGGQRQH